jgi:heme-binding protein
MKMSETTVRRGLYGMFAGGLLAFGSAAIIAPVAGADTTPSPSPGTEGCSVDSIANTSSTVSASTSTYLKGNPEANDALTKIATQSPTDTTAAFRTYFEKNPDVQSQLKTINQPAIDLASQCGIKVTPTPLTAALTDA